MRAPLLALAWICFYLLVARYGVRLLPTSVAQATTLPTYLAGVQLLSVAFGVALVRLVAPRLFEVLLPLPFSKAKGAGSGKVLLFALLLAPLVYVAAHGLGMYFAYDTLIAELAARGTRAVQQQTGELGRAAAQDTLLGIVPFTIIVAPVAEELLFRGAVFGAAQSVFDRFEHTPPTLPSVTHDDPPESLVVAGLPKKRGPGPFTHAKGWLLRGGGAVLVSAAVFGALHADTEGGLGIVRVVSATVLGLCCGLARASSGGLSAAIVLHVGYNFIALGTMRGWLVAADYPTKYGIPTILGPVGGTLVAVVIAIALATRKKQTP